MPRKMASDESQVSSFGLGSARKSHLGVSTRQRVPTLRVTLKRSDPLFMEKR